EIGGYHSWHPFILLLKWIERIAYRDSEIVISNLQRAVDHMVEQGMKKDKFVWIPNGFSLAEVNQRVPLNSKTRSELPLGKFIVGYAGTMGLANSLDTFLETASMLREYNDIAFVLVGA